MSIMRPGVQTTISEPRFRSAICSATPAPPREREERRIRARVRARAKRRQLTVYAGHSQAEGFHELLRLVGDLESELAGRRHD
jgi:hypothetical protein